MSSNTTASAVLLCHELEKTFTAHVRAEGVKGIFTQFFRRETRDVHALKAINFAIPAGSMVGLIGENCAGKTTLVKILTGIIPATSGAARMLERDCWHLRDTEKRRMALVMGQRSQLWWDLPAVDSFRLLKEIYGVSEADFTSRLAAFAARLDVQEQLDVQLRKLSLGQRMKMEIIGALLHHPEILFLDEPTIGLDLLSRETIRRFLLEINQERGVTVLLTSHDMEDIEHICSRILILEEGKLLWDGDLVDLMRRVRDQRRVEVHLEPGASWSPEQALAARELGAELVREAPLTLSFAVRADGLRAFMRMLFEELPVRDAAVERLPLEYLIRDIFQGKAGDLGNGNGDSPAADPKEESP